MTTKETRTFLFLCVALSGQDRTYTQVTTGAIGSIVPSPAQLRPLEEFPPAVVGGSAWALREKSLTRRSSLPRLQPVRVSSGAKLGGGLFRGLSLKIPGQGRLHFSGVPPRRPANGIHNTR